MAGHRKGNVRQPSLVHRGVMMDLPGGAVRDDEPSRDARGGSVVLGLDLSGTYAPMPVQPFGPGDAMRWSPPPEGEDTPPCPA